MDLGLLLLRLAFGTLIAAHGGQKLFGWFGGPGLTDTGTFFESLGFRPGRPFVVAAAVAELGGGGLLVLGLLQPVAAAAVISVMVVAIATVHWGHGLLASTGGIEQPVLYLAAAIAMALTGPGAYSLDAAFELHQWWTPSVTAFVVAAGVVDGLVSLGLRRLGSPVAHA